MIENKNKFKNRARCTVCKLAFNKKKIGQTVCGLECWLNWKKTNEVKKKTQPYIKKRTKKPDSIGRQLELTQKAFNAWIRWRDKDKPCISSGRYTASGWDAGHYIPVGDAKAGSLLRFDEENVHKQNSMHNRFQAGKLLQYRERLVQRIGEEAVNRLEQTSGTRKWSIEELKEMRAYYRKKLRDAQKQE